MLALARVLGYLLALVAGVTAGVLGSFTFAYMRGPWPVGLLVGLCLCLAAFVASGLLLRSRAAAVVAASGWLVSVGFLSMQRPEGDLIVPATTLGYCWLLVGTLVAGLSLAVPYAAMSANRGGSGEPTDAPTVESSGTAPTRR